jgi:hypothetical protein
MSSMTKPRHAIAYLTASILALCVLGCITGRQNPAATQLATAVDLATTQPSYWLEQPAVAQVRGGDFNRLWEAAKETVRDYQLALDREDYRAGVITSVPEISKQVFELWRSDAGTTNEAVANTLGAIRRTIRLEVSRGDDGTFTLVPKVLVERQSIFERRVTDVSQYRFAFAGPARAQPARTAVTLDPETYQDVPVKYWYPIGRDFEMEKKVAARVEKEMRG